MSNGRTHITAIYHTQHILSDLNFYATTTILFFSMMKSNMIHKSTLCSVQFDLYKKRQAEK